MSAGREEDEGDDPAAERNGPNAEQSFRSLRNGEFAADAAGRSDVGQCFHSTANGEHFIVAVPFE